MMKKIVSVLLTLILLGAVAFAEPITVDPSTATVEEMQSAIDQINAWIAEKSEDTDAAAAPQAEASEYTALKKGDKNDAVKALQERLIELNYLSGKADGDFGNMSTEAVKQFQSAAGLEVTGIATPETQQKLFSSDAPKAIVYEELNYKKLERDPNLYIGNYVKFTGRVLQVMEDTYGSITQVTMRIATSGKYDNVVYVTYYRDANESRILEDDKVTIKGVYEGIYSYEAVSGATISIPKVTADFAAVN